MTRPCRRCGHGRDAHQHHRSGTDCGLCECPRWRRWRRVRSWVLRGPGRRDSQDPDSGLARFSVMPAASRTRLTCVCR